MKAAQINKYGGAEVVVINQNAPEPKAGPGQVLVKVQACGVNPADWKIRAGYFTQDETKLPMTLGGDFSGVIMDVGPEVVGFKKDDEVFGQALSLAGGSGSFAELASALAANVALKPEKASFLEAAALPLAGVSALQALTEHINLLPNQKMLIHGGAGGIGTFAIQIAKHLGAFVVTTASGDNTEYVKNLGASEVINYKTEQFEKRFPDFDAVFDTVGGPTYQKSFLVLKPGGTIVSMLEKPNEALAKKYGVKTISQFTQVSRERLEKLAQLVNDGAIKINIDKTFPLEKAGEALEYQEKGHPRGKVVIKIK